MGTAAGMNDATHLGFFDIPLLANIPNLVYLAPTCAEEYFAMLDWAIRQREHPVAVRVPGAAVVHRPGPFDTEYGELNRYRVERRGREVAILALGSFHALGEETADRLKTEAGIDATLVNPRYITGLDEEAAGGAAARSPGGRHAGGRLAGRRFRREDRPAVRPHADAGAELRTPQRSSPTATTSESCCARTG